MAFVVGFSGSTRSQGNTYFLVQAVLSAASQAGALTRYYDLNRHNLGPIMDCRACRACKEPDHLGKCVLEDAFIELSDVIHGADGIVVGAPVEYSYLAGAAVAHWASQARAFLERWYCWRSAEGSLLPAGKRALMICTSRHREEDCRDLLNRQVTWMKKLGIDVRGMMAASLRGPESAALRADLLHQARLDGRWLAGK